MGEIWYQYLFQGTHTGAPLLPQVPVRVQKEGSKATYQDSVGNQQSMDYKKMIVETTIQMENAKGMSFPEFVRQASEPGRKMAEQMENHLMMEMRRVTEQSGQVVDASGEPFHPKHMMEALRKMEIQFNPDGTPQLPSMIVGPDLHRLLAERGPTWENDEGIKSQLKDIITQKKEDFRAREADRRLVD